MNLTFFLVLSLFIRSTMTAEKHTRVTPFVALENKNITSAVISHSIRSQAADCAAYCVRLDECQSFFFNTITGECQLHGIMFTSQDNATDQEGVLYFYREELRICCPEEQGFQMLAKDGPCVKFHFDKQTWLDANKTCKSYSPNSHMVVVDTKEKNDLVKAAGLAIQNAFSGGIYFGLFEYTENNFKWANGRDVNLTQGSFLDATQLARDDCGLFQRMTNWSWKIDDCGKLKHYICEVDLIIK